MTYPKVAIVGKPNVGKSTLFNRLCRKKLAIVSDTAGTTRDRKEYMIKSDNIQFTMSDTAGWESSHTHNTLLSLMVAQTETGIYEADILIFLVDGRNHLSAEDLEFASLLRKYGKPIILAVNKSESRIALSLNELLPLGFGEPIFISAEHAIGIDNLVSSFTKLLQNHAINEEIEQSNNNILLTLVGRPNAGKSTIFNALLGFNRSITSSEAGTTRDAITHDITFNDQEISLIDTAGLRRKNKIYEEIEQFSAGQAITAMKRANIVALIVDATRGVEHQDLAIAEIAFNEGKALMLVLNKYDLVQDTKALSEDTSYLFEHSLTKVANIPFIYTTATQDINLTKILTTAIALHKNWATQISTSQLNKWLEQATQLHQPPLSNQGRRIKFKYITQIRSKPPTFKIFTNLPAQISNHYLSYLSHSLQKYFNLSGTPVRIQFSSTANPYE